MELGGVIFIVYVMVMIWILHGLSSYRESPLEGQLGPRTGG